MAAILVGLAAGLERALRASEKPAVALAATGA